MSGQILMTCLLPMKREALRNCKRLSSFGLDLLLSVQYMKRPQKKKIVLKKAGSLIEKEGKAVKKVGELPTDSFKEG